ncbi:class IIb bacteriocin, lactobin A/cerein 7B family [Undibacterium squillarum]|uniref:class IIb bacteriocin, lactobin A/cerein 7B family n=1 Tax=Undibacterium squillarum TaxID=1131567 RepID=UPI0035ADAE64
MQELTFDEVNDVSGGLAPAFLVIGLLIIGSLLGGDCSISVKGDGSYGANCGW